MKAILRDTSTTALALLAFAVAGTTLLSATSTLTHPAIERTEREAKLRLIAQTLPPGSFDNDLIRETRPLPADPQLGLKRDGVAYVATRAGKPVAVVLEAVAPDGYAGEIKLLVGVFADGRVSGVRVAAHKETPGLGDYIEIARSGWIRQFDGRSLDAPAADGWRVRKDGGQFDYMAGATITPRAVVKAVHKALEYFARHQGELLAPPKGGTA